MSLTPKKFVDANGLTHFAENYPSNETLASVIDAIDANLESYIQDTDTAYRAASIPFGTVDSTSTATVMTATVPGITELRNGVCAYIKNGVITSAAGFTLNVNGLGEKPVYQTLAAATRSTTIFNITYTMLFVYNEDRVSNGCWDVFYGYNSDTNTIAYNIRLNQAVNVMASSLTRYKIMFTMADGKLLPSTATSNSTGTTKTLTTSAFDPFGNIYYYATTSTIAADSAASSSYTYMMHSGVDLRYSFNTGSTLIQYLPVYIRVILQSNGMVTLDGNNCIVQTLPSTEDEKLYIRLGFAYSATSIVLELKHPIYQYKNGKIVEWLGLNKWINLDIGDLTDTNGVIPSDIGDLTDNNNIIPEDINDLTDNNNLLFSGSYNDLTNKPTNVSTFTNDAGYLTQHQDLTSYAPKASPALTGTPTAPTAAAGTNTTQIATTAFVQASLPVIDTTITQNSTNAISSGAVYAALGDIETLLGAL